jgi:hypothetical protein
MTMESGGYRIRCHLSFPESFAGDPFLFNQSHLHNSWAPDQTFRGRQLLTATHLEGAWQSFED